MSYVTLYWYYKQLLPLVQCLGEALDNQVPVMPGSRARPGNNNEVAAGGGGSLGRHGLSDPMCQ